MKEPDAISESFRALRNQSHPACFVCAGSQPAGLHLFFLPRDDGSVAAEFACNEEYEGYPGVIHGGIVTSLLDGAMTNCLFMHGQVAVTARLNVRFRHPVLTGTVAVVRSWIADTSRAFFQMQAELLQAGRRVATADGVFMPARPRSLMEG
jgi:uncharacterized protein (TIGR00369 family)